jgi:rRNA-processing protein FCF1
MNRQNIKTSDYIVSVFATHSIYLDTNILLDEKTAKCWKESILPRLAHCNRKFIVMTSVLAELRKKADAVMSGDADLAYRAKKALDDIDDLVQQNLCEIKKIDFEYEFADPVFYAIFATKRLQENNLLITRDKGLARDVLKLNRSESVRSYRPILVWYLEDSGYLNTHYHWNGIDEPALPTHSHDCRAVIKKKAEKEAKSDLSSEASTAASATVVALAQGLLRVLDAYSEASNRTFNKE